MTLVAGNSPELRRQNLALMDGRQHDVLVVGAGINGTVAAARLAAAGAEVAIVDRGDFGGFTSQESSNLIWGGIKYLENYEFSLVRKLCRARNELIQSYPSNVREVRFLASIDRNARGFTRWRSTLWAGTWLYWLIGNRATAKPRLFSAAELGEEEPCIRASEMRGGVEYSDAYLPDNDARFVFSFVRRAMARGAAAANYVEIREARRVRGERWEVLATDLITGADFTIHAKTLLNTAGPYVDALNQAAGISTRTHHVFSKGIHLVVPRLTRENRVLAFFDDANRLFFVLPMGTRSVIGTTDTHVLRPEQQPTDDDRRFLLDNANRRLALDRPLTLKDVIAERCGVRPLAVQGAVEGGKVEWTTLSRKHVIEVDRERRHISVFGGKLTDCLNVGEELADVISELGIALPRRDMRWCGEPPGSRRDAFFQRAHDVLGGDLPASPDSETLAERWWRRYGESAAKLLDRIESDRSELDPVLEGGALRRCELYLARDTEMIVRLEDFLRRRTKIALERGDEELRTSQGVREMSRILFGEESEHRYREHFAVQALSE